MNWVPIQPYKTLPYCFIPADIPHSRCHIFRIRYRTTNRCAGFSFRNTNDFLENAPTNKQSFIFYSKRDLLGGGVELAASSPDWHTYWKEEYDAGDLLVRARAMVKTTDWTQLLGSAMDGTSIPDSSGWWGKAYLASQYKNQATCLAYAKTIQDLLKVTAADGTTTDMVLRSESSVDAPDRQSTLVELGAETSDHAAVFKPDTSTSDASDRTRVDQAAEIVSAATQATAVDMEAHFKTIDLLLLEMSDDDEDKASSSLLEARDEYKASMRVTSSGVPLVSEASLEREDALSSGLGSGLTWTSVLSLSESEENHSKSGTPAAGIAFTTTTAGVHANAVEAEDELQLLVKQVRDAMEAVAELRAARKQDKASLDAQQAQLEAHRVQNEDLQSEIDSLKVDQLNTTVFQEGLHAQLEITERACACENNDSSDASSPKVWVTRDDLLSRSEVKDAQKYFRSLKEAKDGNEEEEEEEEEDHQQYHQQQQTSLLEKRHRLHRRPTFGDPKYTNLMQIGARSLISTRMRRNGHKWGFVKKAVKTVAKTFDPSKISGWITSGINKALKRFEAGLKAKVIAPITKQLRKLIQHAIAGLTSWVNKIKTFAKKGLDLLKGLIDAVKEQLETVKTWLVGLVEKVKAGFDSALAVVNSAIDAVKTAIEDAKAWVTTLIDAIEVEINKLIEGIKNELKKVETWAKQMVDKVKKGIESIINGIKSVIEEIKNAVKKAWDYAKSLASRLKKLIDSVVDKVYKFFNGLIRKVTTKIYEIKDKVVSFAKTAFDKIKNIGGLLKEAWKEIKKIPKLILELANKAITEVFKLIDYVLKPLAVSGNWPKIKSAADKSCARLDDVPVVGALCVAGQKVFRTIFGQMQDLVSKGVGLIFDELGKIGSKAFSKHKALTFGTQTKANEACVWAKIMFLPYNVIANLMALVSCLVHARLLFGFDELIKLVFDVVLTEVEKLDQGLDLGSKKNANTIVKMSPWIARLGVFGIYMQSTQKINVRLAWVVEGIAHWILDLAGGALKSAGVDFGTRTTAENMSDWKHWSTLGILGLPVRITLTFNIRLYFGITSVLFHLASLLLKLCSLDPIPAPPTPEPACALAVAALKKLDSFVEELPVFVIGLACDMVTRLFRFGVGTVIAVWDKVLDHAIMFLQGEGEIFDIAVSVMESIVEAIAGLFVDGAGADLFDIIDGNIPKNLDFSNMTNPVSLFGLPPSVSQLGVELLVPCVSVGLKYMKTAELLASFSYAGRSGLGDVTNNSESTVGGVNMTQVHTMATDSSSASAVKSPTPTPAASFLEVAMRHGSRAAPNAFKSGSNLGMMGNGLGLGGPVEVRQSYGHKLMIHPRTMLPGFNNVNNEHNNDELGMCVSRQFKLVEDAASRNTYTAIELHVKTTKATSDEAKIAADQSGATAAQKTASTTALAEHAKAELALKMALTSCEFINIEELKGENNIAAESTSMKEDWENVKLSQASRISFWIQEGAKRAFNCIAAKGYTVGVDLVIDQGCGEGKGGPFTLNDMEWAFEGIDECHDTDVAADGLFQGLIKTLHHEIGPSAKFPTVGKYGGAFVQSVPIIGPAAKYVYRSVGKFLCKQHESFTIRTHPNDLDDVEVTMRMCNMESLVMADKGSARPFFGVVEYSQFNNAIKRISFSEYGISFEFQTSIVGIFSSLGKMFGKANNKLKEKIKDGKKYMKDLASSSKSKAKSKSMKGMQVGSFILEMINNLNLQVSLVRNKIGILEFIIDMTSLQNIPNIFQDSSDENSMLAAAGVDKKTSSYMFAFIAPRSEDGSFVKRQFCFIGTCFDSKMPILTASGAGWGAATRAITFSVMTYAFSLFAGRPIENDFSKSSAAKGKRRGATAREICTPSKEEKGECDTVKRICNDIKKAVGVHKATKKKAAAATEKRKKAESEKAEGTTSTSDKDTTVLKKHQDAGNEAAAEKKAAKEKDAGWIRNGGAGDESRVFMDKNDNE